MLLAHARERSRREHSCTKEQLSGNFETARKRRGSDPRGLPSGILVARPPESDPVTMRVHKPTMGERRTLEIGQKTLTRANRPKAPTGRGQARLRQLAPGGRQGSGHKRGHLPPLEGSLRRDELTRGQTAQGTAEGECMPQEAARRKGVGHRPPKGGESGKLLSPEKESCEAS